MEKNVLTNQFSQPLNGIRTATVNIHAGDGNLNIDHLTDGDPLLVCGELQYTEKQGLPTRSMDAIDGRTVFNLQGGEGQPRFRLPWSACNAATNWMVHLNPSVPVELTARSNGGNIKLQLARMTLTRLMTDTGGGNIELVLPEAVSNLAVAARSGAGNVIIQVPAGVATLIHATSGLGVVIVDPQFGKVDKNTYQSPDYAEAARKIEITASTGAGNVNITVI